MKNTNSQVLRKTFAVRFILARFVLARFVLVAILIPALLIGSAFTFGGSNLQAQANGSSKLGFFVGIVYLNGFKVDTTTLVTTNITTITDSITTGYRITGSSDATSIVVTSGNPTWSPEIANGVGALVEANCKDGKTTSVDSYYFENNNFVSFDRGAKPSTTDINNPLNDATVTLSNSALGPFPTGKGTEEKSHCYSYFFGDLSSDRSSIPNYQIATPDSAPTPTSVPEDPTAITSSKSDQLSGIGLQFGFRWEKWRASLTHFTGKGGDNELANTLVMADYFVNKGLFVGGGLASMKLTNSANGSTSASATSPVIQVGYKQNLTPNLSLNFGLTKYISGVSLNHTTTATVTDVTPALDLFPIGEDTKTQTARDSATIGSSSRFSGGGNTKFEFIEFANLDYRIEVTQVRIRTVNINKVQIPAGSETQTETTTETDAELKAPLVISISLHLSF